MRAVTVDGQTAGAFLAAVEQAIAIGAFAVQSLQQVAAARDRAVELWGPAIVTEIVPVETFWMGEEYHQDFFTKNPNQGYCNAVVAPKMAKVRAKFTKFLR